jgi:hypothetical protein
MKILSLPESSVNQSIINTQIIDDFFVKKTLNSKDSVNYLVEFTNRLIELHRVGKLILIYKYFNIFRSFKGLIVKCMHKIKS